MKSVFVFAIASVLAASSAHAASVLIDREAAGLQITGLHYRVNPALGRAWALVETYESSVSGGDEADPSGETRVQVPGLAYDAAAGQIVFAAETGKVVCANVVSKPRKLLITATGACGFHTAAGSVVTDDGFEMHTVRTVDVFFDTK